MLNIGIGTDLFENIIENNCYYVDKTAYIAELFESKGKNVKLITRPRRFGKTLTLSMLDCFFSMAHKDMKPVFEKLAIGKMGKEYMDLQGQYPVVFITLKNLSAQNMQEQMADLSLMMSEVYGNFSSAVKDSSLREQDSAYFKNILNEQASLSHLKQSMYRLSRILFEHFGKKAIMLIDEYDAPIQKAWAKGFYDEAINFYRDFYGTAFKTNPYIEFAIITGIARISKESIFSGLNNLDMYTVTDNRLAGMIGFTEKEVEQLAKDAGAEERLTEIKEWYDGYLFGDKEIYNPWSLLKYIDMGCVPDVYWLNTSGNDILKQLLHKCDEEKSAEIMSLYEGGSVSTYLNEGTVYADIFTSEAALYTMMLSTGYLKAQKSKTNQRRYEISIPNKEITEVYRSEIINNMGNDMDNTIDRLLDGIMCGDVELFQKQMQKILLQSASYHDVAHEPELFYHALMLGLTVGVQPMYKVKSNREAGYGRFDLAFFPSEKAPADAMAVIMEFKKASSDGKRAMNNACKKALKQIEENQYVIECSERNITRVLKYGVAFNGKAIQVLKE